MRTERFEETAAVQPYNLNSEPVNDNINPLVVMEAMNCYSQGQMG